MKRKLVSSSMIRSMGYDAVTETLEIEFQKGGAVWQYYHFSKSEWNKFRRSESFGQFWHAHIKNQYAEARVG